MENIEKKAPIISASSFVLILLFCLLPFISVQCGGSKIAEATGVDLISSSVTSSEYSTEKSPNIFMILVILAAFAGIAVSIIFKNNGKKYKISVICSSAIIAVSLILMRFYISYKLKAEMKKGKSEGEFSEMLSGITNMINVNYEIGYWLCLIFSIALIFLTIFLKRNDTDKNEPLNSENIKVYFKEAICSIKNFANFLIKKEMRKKTIIGFALFLVLLLSYIIVPNILKSYWEYEENIDKMDGVKNYFAKIYSLDKDGLRNESSGFKLTIENKNGEEDILLTTGKDSRNYFRKSKQKCRIKFDDEPAYDYDYNENADFISKLKTAKNLMIECETSGEKKLIDFGNVKGLKWKTSGTEKTETAKRKTNWEYSENVNQMDGAKTYFADIYSLDKDGFHNNESGFRLLVRNMNKENEVLLITNSNSFSHFSTGKSKKCRVKFDDEPIEDWRYDESGNREIIFFKKPKDFISKLKTAKDLMIECEISRVTKVFDFGNVEGLEWNHSEP